MNRIIRLFIDKCKTPTPAKKGSIVTGVSKPVTSNFSASSFSVKKPVKIKILGTGCTKCAALTKTVQDVVVTLDEQFEVVKVEDIQEIMAYQVMSTPALVIDGKVKSTGKLLTYAEVKEFLQRSKS